MNWLDVFCFISVTRTRSFSVSARELMISQQAVSRHIQNLEDETGLSLFLRNYHEIHLTKAGEQMLQCLLQRENMVKAFKEELQGRANVLRVGWNQWLGCPEAIRQRLRDFCATHPDLVLLPEELSDGELQRALQERRLDLLLTTGYICRQMNLSQFSSAILEEPLYLLEASHENIQPALRLSQIPHIAAPAGDEDKEHTIDRVRAEYAQMGLRLKQVEVVENPRSVYLNVLLKDGAAFTVARPILSQNKRFVLTPLERTVTVVLCRAFRPWNPKIRDLELFLLQREEAEA